MLLQFLVGDGAAGNIFFADGDETIQTTYKVAADPTTPDNPTNPDQPKPNKPGKKPSKGKKSAVPYMGDAARSAPLGESAAAGGMMAGC